MGYRLWVIGICLLSVVHVYGLTIPQGTLYFDNSKTKYNAVRFVYGDAQKTTVLAMTQDGIKWSVNIPQQVNDMYRFTFVGSDVNTGVYDQSFSTYKDYISNTLGINRTATSEAQMNAGDIFVPSSGDNWAQGSWTALALWEASQGNNSGEAKISGTLPVVYINTTNNAVIDSKETYVPGTLYIDALSTDYKSLGTSAQPIAAQFKGRGNYTWIGFDKKPYRIKFDAKQEVLGMPKNKHWCLMAGADDCMGFLKNPMGYMLSEAVGLAWTPRTVPVEVVLNGQYWGLYFLTEQVRVGSNRVNITEQEDNATEEVSGGWLVEIDNYREDGNVEFDEGNGQHVMVTPKSPEILSNEQYTYFKQQMLSLNDAIYAKSSYTLLNMLDMESAAKYYVVQEVMEDCESYHGSCYLYKDRDSNGKTAKWYFGPVWDFGNAYNRDQNTWIYVNPTFDQYWIAQIASRGEFKNVLAEQWYIFRHDKQQAVREQIKALATLIAKAAANDAARWNGTQNYCNNSNMTARLNDFISRYDKRTQWLYSQWGEGTKPSATWNNYVDSEIQTESEKVIINGQLFIRVNHILYDITGKRIQ